MLTKDPTFHAQLKHINLQFHYTQEQVDERDITFKYLPTDDMPADIMTKALHCPKHEKFVMLLGLSHTDHSEGECWNLHNIKYIDMWMYHPRI